MTSKWVRYPAGQRDQRLPAPDGGNGYSAVAGGNVTYAHRSQRGRRRNVVAKYTQLQFLHGSRRLEPELVGEPAGVALVRREGVGLAPARVQGPHVDEVGTFSERMFGSERLQSRKVGRALVQAKLMPTLDRLPTRLLEPERLKPGHWRLGELGVGRTLP
jgi:hypothetical protein